MDKPNYPTVTATVLDEDTVHIGGDFFKREWTCKSLTFVADEIENIKLWHTECSVCSAILGQGKSISDATVGLPNFCPSCGARVERDA